MQRRRSLALAVLLALAALGGAPSVGRAADPLEINAILPLTGGGAFVGKAVAKSIAMLETTVNADGGIAGRPVKFVVNDDQSSPQVAVQLTNALLAKGVHAILGAGLVANCEAMEPLVKGRAVAICLSAGFHPQPNSFSFTSGVSTIDQLVFAVKYLHDVGIRKLAVLTSADANGQDADRGVALALSRPENKDMALVAALHFNLADLTVDAQMARIKASGAQAVINYNTGAPFGTVLHGYSDTGLTIPLVTQPAALNYSVMQQYAAYAPKELLITGLVGDAPDVAPDRQVEAAQGVYAKACKDAGVLPDHLLALAWDPGMILVTALRKAGPDASGQQLVDVINNLRNWAGINGEYDFHAGPSGLTPNAIVMVRWNADKKVFTAVSRAGGAPLQASR